MGRATWSNGSRLNPAPSHYPRGVSSPELSVVCRSCGEEVSPYVTECPYCGTRLRKRAPKLELRGDEVTPRKSRRARRRLGLFPTAVLIIACGALGMLAADGIHTAFAPHNDVLLAAGGNGIALGLLCCWAVIRAAELRADPSEDIEVIGAAVAAAVLILLPLVDDFANVFAGLTGALVGAGCGLAASLARRERRPG